MVGQQLQESLGQPFVVENKPGAQGAIASAEVARAAPDGYTLMVGTNTPHAANPSLFKKLNYDPAKDFAPVARLGTTSFMIMVRPDFPAKNFKEFLAHAESKPRQAFRRLRLRRLAGIARDAAARWASSTSSRCPTRACRRRSPTCSAARSASPSPTSANALAQIKGGKLRGIAVTSQKRSPLAPDVPAIAEELPGYELIAWFALVAPAGTPRR